MVPVTGIGTGVNFADTVAVLDGLTDAVAVGDADDVDVFREVVDEVAVGDGDGVEQRTKLVVQVAPKDGQQYLLEPQSAIVPTLAIVEQLISLGTSPLEDK